jgi:beta-lactamase regulating signal transducer with metallopeptidase domain
MTAETMLAALVRLNLVASVAIMLVLALRPLVLRRFGASIAYWLWLVVPIAATASFLPARVQIVPMQQTASLTAAEEPVRALESSALPDGASAQVSRTPPLPLPALADLLVAVWLLGAAALFARSIVTTRRLAADASLGPALVGVLRPKLVLPADFETRFDAEERALILAHEEVHRVSGHTIINALVELARCANWFNPLAHVAARQFRVDQELACDAAVIAVHPSARRAYAEALLKTQVVPAYLPLGCAWTSRPARSLGERIVMLGRPSLSRGSATLGASTVALLGLALGYAAWAQQPERLVTQVARPEAVWTPAAQAPEGVLSHELEGRRHDLFIELAQAGGIDLVFFGTTATEMWWWDRGRDVWDRAFGSLKAANFGSQGTQPRSLLWRMQNGELDGYEAKLIVLQAWGIGDNAIPDDGRAEFIAGFRPIIAEILARQPQAKLLIMAPLPRGSVDLERWRQRAESIDAALTALADNATVFYANFGASFFDPDGSFKRETWSLDFNNRGTQTAAFEIWAEELQPWLDRFVR